MSDSASPGDIAAAFGAAVGDAGEWVPAHGAWAKGVASAGEGAFAAARTAVGQLRGPGVWSSAARCLEASMLRQTGRHRLASAVDGAAVAALAGMADDADPVARAFAVDGLVGLAADALGTGRYALAHTLIARARARIAAYRGPQGPWWTLDRAALRCTWVAAETAVYSGDGPGARAAAKALADADPGVARPRHHAKTLLVRAAAVAGGGDSATALELALRGHEVSVAHDLRPLQWAGARLAAALTDGESRNRFDWEADSVVAVLTARGADFSRYA
ncbi:hypothetical protein P0W64_14555 [Tsukamurella sp. 8F]|uniref:hypothetical protein n=1 Tax=unclassified Tsukamurella TaxID=2633480 RepID=UPI0023B97AD2|nr:MULTISPECIES: hypothetical protein [unclassified Tsukamurella]MDF0531952.1 hypothetical protein [Tsukamurella sp. 8J]MDF0587997.1 hypothetical protein [Tsukamurella sp. 8F]